MGDGRHQPQHQDDNDQDLEDLGKALAGLGAALLVLFLVRDVDWLVRVLAAVAALEALWAAYLAWQWLRGTSKH